MKNSELRAPVHCKHRLRPPTAYPARRNVGRGDISRPQAGSRSDGGSNGAHGDIHHPQSRRDGAKKIPLRTLAARSGMIPMFRDR